MGSGVVGVIVTYWPSRLHIVSKIIEGFRESTVQVDELILWNNHPSPIDPIDGVTVVNSSQNYTSRAKYAAAMMRPSPYYLLVDDDVMPRTKTIEHMLKWAEPGCCLAFQGFKMTKKCLSDCIDTNGLFIDEPQPVDAFIGVCQFLSMGAIANMFAAEEKVRADGEFLYDGEDLLVAMANDSLVVPCHDEEGNDWGYFPFHEAQEVEAMKDRPGYFPLRDAFAWKAWQALGRGDLPGRAPVGAAYDDVVRQYRKQESLDATRIEGL